MYVKDVDAQKGVGVGDGGKVAETLKCSTTIITSNSIAPLQPPPRPLPTPPSFAPQL